MIFRIFSTLWILAWVFALSQLPVFVAQYEMRLEGHTAENRKIVRELKMVARRSGLTPEEHLKALFNQPDLLIRSHAEFVRDLFQRQRFLTQASLALREAHPFVRPIVMLKYFDKEILQETWQGFIPGFLLSRDAIVWGAIGAIMSIGTLCLPRLTLKKA